MIADFSLGPESTAAIIYRTNAQSRYLEEACVARNLPYVIRGGAGGFYKRAEVKDCLCFLRWLYNGNDESAMIRAFKTPSRGLGDKAIVEFKEYCTAVDNFYRESMTGSARPSKLDVLTSMVDLEEGYKMFLAQGTPEPSEYISKRALNNFLPFATQMSIIRAKAFVVPVDSLLFFIIEALNLISHFDSISKSKAEFEERRENVQELRQATKRYSSGGPALVDKGPRVMDLDDFDDGSPLGHFLDDVSLVSDIAPDNAESKDARFVVNLMTIHASKGMEFDAVFVVGNEEGTLPSSLSLQEGENSIALEEERRLCYVAMTRAKTRLILSWRKEVSTFASWSADGPRTVTKSRSRFLDSLVKSNSGDKKVPMKSREAKEDNPYRPLQQRKSLTSSVSHRKRSDIDQIYPEKPHLVPKRPPSSSQKSFSERGPTPRHIDRDMPTSPRKAHNRIPADLSIKSPATRPYSNSKTPADRQDSKSMLKAKANQGTSIPFDSTLFYPVGSDVIHNNFGRGMVLEPPPISSVSGKLLVRVQFENGRTMEFPVEGSDLIPVF